MLHAHLNYITTKFKTRALFSFVTLSLCLSSSDAGSMVSSLWLLWRREEVCLHHRAEMIRLPSAPQHSVDWSSPPPSLFSYSHLLPSFAPTLLFSHLLFRESIRLWHTCCQWWRNNGGSPVLFVNSVPTHMALPSHTCLHSCALILTLTLTHTHTHTHTHTQIILLV